MNANIKRINGRSIALAVLGIACAAAVCALFLARPKNIVGNPDRFYVYQVVYEGEDVTGRVDCDALASIVQKYQRSRLPHDFTPVQDAQILLELNCDDVKPLHILLGDINVAYESGDKGGYTIRDSEKLLAEILPLIQGENL